MNGETDSVTGRKSRGARLRRFERHTSMPLLVLSVVFIVLVVLPYAVDLTPGLAVALDRAALVIWAVFVAEFVIRLFLAPDKLRFVLSNPLDLLAVALPMLRPLRVVRTAGLLRAVGVARAEASLVRLLRRGRRAFGRHRILYSSLVIALVTLGAAIVTHQAEQEVQGSTLTTFGGTLWWAVQVVTTVGSADAYPVTLAGRISAVVLMVVGVGLFGLVAATLAATYIFRGDEGGSQSHSEARTDLRTVAERLERIEGELHELRASVERGPSARPPEEPPAAQDQRRAA